MTDRDHQWIYRVLVIEDDDEDYEFIKRAAGKSRVCTFVLTHAKFLSSARMAIAQNDYDVVLVDMNLPDSTGVDTVRDMLELLPHTPVVVCSSNSEIEVALQAVRLGAADFCVKPPNPDELERKLSYAVETAAKAQRRLRLLHKSTKTILADAPTVEGAMLAGPLRQIRENITRVRNLLRKQYPGILDDVERVWEEGHLDLALGEMEKVLRLTAGPVRDEDDTRPERPTVRAKGRRSLSEKAMEAVTAEAGDYERISTVDEAMQALQTVIESE